MEIRPETHLQPEVRAIESKYKRDVAIVTTRPRLETAFFIVWAVVDILLLAFFVSVIVFYLVSGSFSDARLTRSFVDNAPALRAANVRTAVQPMRLGSAQVITLGGGRYDIFADIENPNNDWVASFAYHYEFGGNRTESEEGFLNPGEERSLPLLNIESAVRPSSPRLVIEDIVWRHINAHVVPSVESFLAEHKNFTLDSAVYANDVLIGSDRFARSTLTLTNRTAYAYWEPMFVVKLVRGSNVIGITQVTVPEFGAGETRVVDVRWIGDFPASATVVIEPAINFFDRDVYMNPDSEELLDVRQ